MEAIVEILSHIFDFYQVDHITSECLKEEETGRVWAETTRPQVKESFIVQFAGSCTVTALDIVGINHKFGFDENARSSIQ
jgi:hypothetical protein